MATTQMQRPKTGNWSAIFPNQQVTEQQSALFVKKLLAVSISNITYLRTIFPEHAFGDRCLEDLNLKILRDDSACPGACQVIQWVKGCFDALDKKYLRMIVVAIYRDKDEPDTIVESYTFKFSYDSGKEGISIYRNGSKLAGACCAAETRKATIKLLRTIVVLTQTLKPLPDDVMMTMKLLYYDDVTPQDYEPPGFRATAVEDFFFKDEPLNVKVGDVSTSFHTVKLRIRTECQQFSVMDEEVGTEQTPVVKMELLSAANQVQLKTSEQPAHVSGDDVELMEATQSPPTTADDSTCSIDKTAMPGDSDTEDNPTVRCPCDCNEDDGLMIMCGMCKMWQHAVCFGLLEAEAVPDLHVCNDCSKTSSQHPCTDPSLSKLSDIEAQSTCLWRRALLACLDMNRILTPTLSKRLGVATTVAQGLANRLQNEGFIKQPVKGKRLGKTISKDKVRKDGFQKYFQVMQKSTDQSVADMEVNVASLARKTCALDLTSSATMLPPVKPPLALVKDLPQEVRRSPRIAKRVRSLVDQSVEFELSDSQDHDTSKDGNERMSKRRKASIASRSILV